MSDLSTVVLGEALIDVVHRPDGSTRRVPGGSGANTALALARLGRPVTLSTCLGADGDGRAICDRLEQSGVEVVNGPIDRTSTAEALIGSDGAASYFFDVTWTPRPMLPQVPDHLHMGSISVVLEPGSRVVQAIAADLASRATVSYDVNMRPGLTGTGPGVARSVTAMIGLADIVKLSDEDAAVMWPSQSVEDTASAILAAGAVAVVVTRGGEGATWFGAEGRVDVAATTGEVVDTIGAGDTFSGGMIAALGARDALGASGRSRLRTLAAEDWRHVLEYAARAAAVTVSREGADPPYAAELQER